MLKEMEDAGASTEELAAAEREMDLEDEELLAELGRAFDARQDGPIRALAAAQHQTLRRSAGVLLKGGDDAGMTLPTSDSDRGLDGGTLSVDYEAMVSALKKDHYDNMSRLSEKLGATAELQRQRLREQLARRRAARVDELLAKGVTRDEAEATAELELSHGEKEAYAR